MTNKEFIESIAGTARSDMTASGILTSITIAQACLESAYGTSELATQANNLFGMKATLSGNTWASDWDGSTYAKETKEQDSNGNEYTVLADFRKYLSWTASIKDHSDYLNGAMNGSSLRYAGLSGCRDYRTAAQIIKDGGYATDTAYVDKLCKVIEDNNLTQYDYIQEENKMKIINKLAIKNPCYKAGKTIAPAGVMIHSVGCSQPDPLVFVNTWQSENAETCVHAVLGVDENVYQLLPWNHRAWHCGSGANGSCNNTHISFEMTEPATIKYTGGSTWEDLEPGNTRAHVLATYRNAIVFAAYLCKEYDLDPQTDGVLISHSEGHKRGLASNHGDVEHIWSKFGLTMDQFRLDVKAEMGQQSSGNKSGWYQENGGWRFYLGDTGDYVKNDWYREGDDWYWFDGNGMMIADNWKTGSDGKWYYMTGSGAMAKNKWAIWDEELYRLTEDGSMYEGRLNLKSDEKGALQLFNEGTNELGYVKDGMILCLDGIRNTRYGHDEAVTYWHDLSGNQSDPVLLSGNGMSFGETYCHMEGGYWRIDAPEYGLSPMTFEIVCQTDEDFMAVEGTGGTYLPGIAGNYTNGMFRFAVTPDGKYAKVTHGSGSPASLSIDQTKKIVFSVVSSSITQNSLGLDKSNVKTYVNGGAVGDNLVNSAYVYKNSPIHLGKTFIANAAYPWFGKIYSVRIYNRELSQEELDYNYSIDRVRFNF